MPNFAATLKAEISRLARKEVRAETESLKKALAVLKTELNATKKKLRELEAQTKKRSRQPKTAESASAGSSEEPVPGVYRFSAKGLATNRARLGLSATQFGRLVGATGQAVSGWEKEINRPRAKYLPAIAELRRIGKKEVAKRLESLR